MVKKTIDIWDKNDEILRIYKEEYGIGYGRMVNGLISSVCLCPDSTKSEMLAFIKDRMKLLRRQIVQSEGLYWKEAFKKDYRAYESLARYLNDGIDIEVGGRDIDFL